MSRSVNRAGQGVAVPRSVTVIGAVLMVGIVASLISPRLLPFALLAVLIALTATAYSNGRLRELLPAAGVTAFSLMALVFFAAISLLWAEQGLKALPKLASVAATIAGAVVISHGVLREPLGSARHWATALRNGFLAGLAFLLIEVFASQAIQIGIYSLLDLPREWMQPMRHFTWNGDTLIAIEPAHINRHIAVLALLAFPAALAVLVTLQSRWRGVAAAALVLLALACAAGSRHESSLAALVIGSLAFLLARISLRWGGRLLGAGWLAACLAVMPVAFMAHRADLHQADWLHHSLRHRIIIWNTTAEETLKSPVLGIGAYMTYVLMPERNKVAEKEEGSEYKKTFSRHAHNVYLQTWFELGAIGAILLSACGLALIAAIRGLSTPAQPFALATFAAAAVMMSASYGMWQSWYVALFAFCAVAVALAARAAEALKDGAAE